MGDKLNNEAALVFVKDLSTWLVVNNKSEPTIWLGAEELAWFFASILELGTTDREKLVAKNAHTKASGQSGRARDVAGYRLAL